MPKKKLAEATATNTRAAVHLPGPAARLCLAGVSKRGLRGEGVRRGGVSRIWREFGDGEADMSKGKVVPVKN